MAERQPLHVFRGLVVSMSFGTSEFAGEQYFDNEFMTPTGHQGVAFVASTGDCGPVVEYPASSPEVLALAAPA